MNILIKVNNFKKLNIKNRNLNISHSNIIINKKSIHEISYTKKHPDEVRINEVGVQMINEKLRSHLFKNNNQNDPYLIRKAKEHLKHFNLNNSKLEPIKDIGFIELPNLLGKNIDEHFLNIGRKQLEIYLRLISQFANSEIPPMPKNFNFSSGWTKYNGLNNEFVKVDYPSDDALVFDVESLVLHQNCPVIAVAVSSDAWYSWCSERLIQNDFMYFSHLSFNDLIPMESSNKNERKSHKRIVIGHNVGYDRSYIREQYHLDRSGLRFLDTMSMHIACFGFTSEQRSLLLNKKEFEDATFKTFKKHKNEKFQRTQKPVYKWKDIGSLNNLKDVHQLHCSESEPIEKGDRNIFVKGSPNDVIDNFQSLMVYCAKDVKATFEVYQKLIPIFLERFPHPITLNGMLEMGTMYLPVNQNWFKYIESCQNEFDDAQYILKKLLEKSANKACRSAEQKDKDPWLFNLDWETKNFKLLKESEKPEELRKKPKKNNEANLSKDCIEENPLYKILSQKYKSQIGQFAYQLNSNEDSKKTFSTNKWLPKKIPHLCNYPNWYRELCPKLDDKDWQPTPALITTKTRVTPNLLRLTWKGYPMHHHEKLGWGYLMNDEQLKEQNEKEILEARKTTKSKNKKTSDNGKNSINKPNRKPFEEIIKISENTFFKKIPHKDGDDINVGNPLSKSFVNKINEGIMSALPEKSAILALKLHTNISYWENNEKRIKSQKVIWLENNNKDDLSSLQGAILPITIAAGTITRRAVEPTWLTASNYQKDRIGGELKTMIQAPDGYNLVGADVDSQELWIASTIGDSHFAKIHGSTALGWMNLQGKKSNETDMHSKTASLIGISRDQAKVFNYGRIYGAGRAFAEKLLLQFNPTMDEIEAKQKAKEMYEKTKGKRQSIKKEHIETEFNIQDDTDENNLDKIWVNGTESEMFNKLEDIARSPLPQTPVLQASITKTLEPCFVQNEFITSRINWVVQSSAVDYLHIMLTCMNWLIEEYNINARFSISIHDEVRYLVKEDDKYRAALALQITNLYTRSLFSYKLGFDDLPMSVAFFSAVDIDKCLRKEPDLEFVCPSNPSGLTKGYGIAKGCAMNIYEILERTNGKIRKIQNK